MATPRISDLIKIRREIIKLNDEDFKDLVSQIGIIDEIRQEMKKKATKGASTDGEPATGNGNQTAS